MRRLPAAWLGLTLLVACATPAGQGNGAADGGAVQLILAGYSTLSESYNKLIPLFVADRKARTGQDVTFAQSYQGSGALSRAVIGGLEADVVVLALAPDVDSIKSAGLITHDWTTAPHKGFVSNSVIAFAVRKGNPKNIHDWADLAQAGLNVLTPDAATSGGARWVILGLYGAALRGRVTGVAANDPSAARVVLTAVLQNVSVLDRDARSSLISFERGIGEVVVTYENEVMLGRQRGQDYELVVPHSTILMETPAAVVDVYADKHGTRAAAEDFVNFLSTPAAQQVLAQYGFRPVDAAVAKANAGQFQAIIDPFTISQFGGWTKASAEVFGASGIYTLAIAAAAHGK